VHCFVSTDARQKLFSWNAFISVYVDFGNIESVRRFFDAMPQRDTVSWITMIVGCSKCGDVVLSDS
jgi:pentatricopeptide repeat protein